VVEVVVEAEGPVVVVASAGTVVLVVLVVLVVTDVDDDVVVEVVVGVPGGVVDGVKIPPTEVPLPALPKMSASGLPEISSTAVMKSSASTKTIPIVAAMTRHENPGRAVGRPVPPGATGNVVAWRRSVAGASATGEISRRSVSPATDAISTVSAAPAASDSERPMTSVGADAASCDDELSPLAPVPPNLRSNVTVSGARTTCLTAS
jgi:hypothetical protein